MKKVNKVGANTSFKLFKSKYILQSFAVGEAQNNLKVSLSMMKATEEPRKGFPWYGAVFIVLGVCLIGAGAVAVHLYRRQRIDKVTILGTKAVTLPVLPAVYERVQIQRIFEVYSDDATLQEYCNEDDSNSGFNTLGNESSISKFLPVSIVQNNKTKGADEVVDFSKTASSFISGIDLLPESNDQNETCEEELDYATQENKTEGNSLNEFIYRPKVGISLIMLLLNT